jgi:hypothetical protein
MRVEAADAVECFGAHGLPVGTTNVTAKPGKRHRQPLYNTGKAFDAHQRHVAQAAAAEQRQRRHDAVRKSTQQRATKQLFTTQQHNNYMREEQLGTTLREQREEPAAAQSKHGSSPVRRPRSAPAVKDWRYYRRQGFIWTDLYHTSQSSESRMRTVVQPEFIERDRDFLQSLIAIVQHEDEVAAAEAAEHLEMVAKQREQFRLKQQGNRTRQAQLQTGVSATLTMSTSTLKLDRTRSLSPGLTQLAQPKKQFSKSSVLLTAGHSDMKGLLCTDPALVDVMPWHLQHETRQVAAEQRLSKQLARTASTRSSSSKQQQQRPHSAAAAVAYSHTMYAKSSTEKHMNSDVETCSQSSSDTDNISYWMSRSM